MKVSVFYSWQSDTRSAANRTLIQKALEAATAEVRDEGSIIVEPTVDRDTLSVPGAPDIGATIFKKIDASAVFVADVTIVNDAPPRPTPNPNVLIELGYALKSLGDPRVVLVQNLAFGGPEMLPFDLRQKRVITYNSSEDAPSRADERRGLQADLRRALTLILSAGGVESRSEYPVELAINYTEERRRSERHDYKLQVTLKNSGTRPITEWHVDVEIPTVLLEHVQNLALRVAERSDRERAFLRATQANHHGPIYPGDTQLVMAIDYRVNNEIYMNRGDLFERSVMAKAYIRGDLAAAAEKPVRDLQVF